MTHWAGKYLGIPYHQKNCAQLVAHIMAEQFTRHDITNALNAYPQHSEGTASRARAIQAHAKDLAIPVATPLDGHPVLLMAGNRLQHIGLCIVNGWNVSVLHTTHCMGSVCEPLERVRLKYKPQFYSWI